MAGVLPEPQPPGRFVSIAIKLALAIVAVLLLASLVVANRLSERARNTLIESKRTAAAMVADLYAASVAPAVDFADEETLKDELANLAGNREIVYAATWAAEGDQAMGQVGKPPTPRASQRPAQSAAATHVEADHIELVRPVLGPNQETIGTAVVYFTLAPENAEYRRTRQRILIYSLGLAGALAALVLGIVRLTVVGRLDRLIRATRRVRQGKSAKVEVKSHDEVGRLGEAFNVMATAILDRETRLHAAHQRIQELLDHMRQGIVVFGPAGAVEAVHSKQAESIFVDVNWHRCNVIELLYPGRDTDVEVRAFREWVDAAFGATLEDWDALLELAPRSVLIHPDTEDEVALALDFIPIPEGPDVTRVMLLATDETDKRRLERTVRAQEETHARQMSAMRRLVAGGGQLLVGVLDAARDRIAQCRQILGQERVEPADVERLFRAVHTIKGEARSFDLGSVGTEATELEDLLGQLRQRLRTAGEQLLDADRSALGARLDRLTETVANAETMLVEASPIGRAILDQVTVRRPELSRLVELTAQRRDELGQTVERLASRPFGEAVMYLVDAVPGWAEREGKRVQLQIEGKDVPIPPGLARALPGVLTHLTRNAVSHGLETSEQREAAGKPPLGLIRLAAAEQSSRLTLVVEDDGRGLDAESVRARAQSLGLDPTRSVERELLFADGLSTAPEGTDLAGRGVGLSAVRGELQSTGFDITITSAPGAGVTATIALRQGLQPRGLERKS